MIRLALLISSICSLFVLSWGISRWFAPQNCINSTLVGKVVIHPQGDIVRKCSPLVRVFNREAPSLVTQNQLFRRFQKLEALTPYLNRQEPATTVVVLAKGENELTFDNQKIRISRDLVGQPGLLERALLYANLNNGNVLTAAVVADFLWEEFAARETMPPARSWVQYLMTLPKYCQSTDVLLAHYEFCFARNDLNGSFISDTENEGAVPWSLVPLYKRILRDIYGGASLAEKKTMLENLMFLGEIEDSFIEEPVKGTSLASQDGSFENMILSWTMPLLLPPEGVRKAVAHYSVQNLQNIDYVYLGRSSRHLMPYDLAFSENEPVRESLIFQLGLRKYFYTSDVGLSFSREDFFKITQVRNILYVSCEMPEVESLLDFDHIGKKVVFIKYCEEGDVDWTSLSRMGLAAYLQKNSDVEFIEFNLSALKLAKRMRGPLRDTGNFSSWQKWLLWQNVVSDEESMIKRPLSAIDGVGHYRIF